MARLGSPDSRPPIAPRQNFGDVGAHHELVDLNFGEGAIASIVAKKDELEKLKSIGYVGTTKPGQKPAPVRADWMHSTLWPTTPELDQIILTFSNSTNSGSSTTARPRRRRQANRWQIR